MNTTTTTNYEGVGNTRAQAYNALKGEVKVLKGAEVMYQVRVTTEGSTFSEGFPESEYEAAILQAVARSDVPAEKLEPGMLEIKATVAVEVKNKPKPTGSNAEARTSTINHLV